MSFLRVWPSRLVLRVDTWLFGHNKELADSCASLIEAATVLAKAIEEAAHTKQMQDKKNTMV